ncbi:TolB family protein [Amycolatopsis sp. lyj-112]|uniref:TolB family protein n=1 Tax=Amycolatopsis sp. lyj-112 TaxID=2789288 RepID=UPI00397B2147
MKLKTKLAVVLSGTVALVAASAVYIVQAQEKNPGRQAADVAIDRDKTVDLREPGRLVFRNISAGPDHGKVASVPLAAPDGPRRVGPLSCDRFYAAADGGLCLAGVPSPLPSAVALSVDASLTEKSRVDIAGIPNRAKLSADGRMASWTTFVTGDSYSQPGSFSTRTAILDRREDQLSSNIEDIPLLVGEERHHGEDVNYWGVTFAADNRTFYATVSTGGRTYLMRGDNQEWRAHTLRENAECPSLSPDGTKLAFKKRVSDDDAAPWREHVLDLATMKETPLAETRSVDDQVVWLDDRTIAYGLPGENGGPGDIWAVPADGSGAPRLLVAQASSPSVTRVS